MMPKSSEDASEDTHKSTDSVVQEYRSSFTLLVSCAVLAIAVLRDNALLRNHDVVHIPIYTPGLDQPKFEPPSLAWLLQPLTVTSWFDTYFEVEPVLFTGRPLLYTELGLGLDHVDSILAAQRKAALQPLLLHPETKHSQADCSVVAMGMGDLAPRYMSMYHAYLDGSTLVCNIVPSYWRPLAELVEAIGRETGHSYMANMYLSPRASQGFTDHTDNKDGLILMAEGVKRWILHRGKFRNPQRRHMRGRPHELPVEEITGELIFNATIHTGDLLHVPRGVVHHAAAVTNEPALHYTISAVKNSEWSEFLLAYCKHFDVAALPVPSRGLLVSIVPQAITAEADEPSSYWIRGALPVGYRQAKNKEMFRRAVADAVGKLKKMMVLRLLTQLKSNAAGEAALMSLFDSLADTWSEAATTAISAALAEDAIYANYVDSLIAYGREGILEPEGALLQDTELYTTEAATPNHTLLTSTVMLAPDRQKQLLLGISGEEQGAIKIRWTPELDDAIIYVQQREDGKRFQVQDLPLRDPFERVCLARVIVSLGALKIALN